MIRKFARFEVQRDALEEALAAIGAFVDEVGRKEGGTAEYVSYQDVDAPTRFTHFMAFRTPAAEKYHQGTAWCRRFVETVGPLCVAPPVVTDVQVVGG